MTAKPLHSALLAPLVCLGLAGFSLPVRAAPVSIIIQPTTEAAAKDTKIYENVADSNFSSTLDVYAPDAGATFSSLVQFDLLRIQSFSSAQILSASLALYSYSTSNINGTVTVSPITSPWSETAADVTATGAPLATYLAVYGPAPTISVGSAVDTQTITSTGYHGFNVASLVKSWVSGTPNNGFFLAASAGMVPFADTDSPFTGIGPMLSVVVDDTVAPVITTAPAARTLVVGADGKVPLPDLRSEVVATDNTGIASVTQSPAAGTLVGPGTTTVTLTVKDLANLSVQAQVALTVNDTTAPAFTQPSLLSLTADPATGLATVPNLADTVTAADNVGITSRTQTPAAGSSLGLGESTIVISLQDAAGNETLVTVPVEVDYDRPDAGPVHTLAGLTASAAPSAGAEGGVPTGTTIASFSTPAISSDRDLVVLARLASGVTTIPAIYAASAAGEATLLAFKGSAAGAGITYKSFLDPVISPSGAVAFAATVQGAGITAANDQGIWSNVFGGGLHAVLREGGPAPGLPVGAVLKSVTSYSLRDAGLLALVTLRPGAGGVTAANDTALILQTGEGAGLVVVREGTPLSTGGSPVKTISALNSALLSPGQGRSQGDATAVAKVTLQNGSTALVKLKAGVPALLLASGSPAYAGPYGSVFQSFGLPATDAAGAHLVFSAGLKLGQGGITAANDTVLVYSSNDTDFTFLAREGQEAAEAAGATYAGFYDPVVNSEGKVAYLALLKGARITAANHLGLWFGTAAAPHLLARQGSAAPGADGQPLTAKFASFTSVALPDGATAGPVVLATLSGTGVTSANSTGVWAVDSTGKFRLLLRAGDLLNLGTPTVPVTKTVKSIALLEAANGVFGASRSFNATGSLAAEVTFTDRTQSVLRIDLP